MTQQQQLKKTLRVFLSYSSDDRWFARSLLDRLVKHPRVSVFATQSLSAGEDWQRRLKEELVRSNLFLVVLSTRSVRSRWVLYELGAAWALGKQILAVLTEPEVRSSIPIEARHMRLVEARELEGPDALSRLLEAYDEAPPPDAV